MPQYTFSAPDGMTLTVDGDAPPAEADLDRLFYEHRQRWLTENQNAAPEVLQKAVAAQKQLAGPAGGLPALLPLDAIRTSKEQLARLPKESPEAAQLQRTLQEQARLEFGGPDGAATAGFGRTLLGQGLARILAHQPYVSDAARDAIMRRVELSSFHAPDGFLENTAAFAGGTVGDAPFFAATAPVAAGAKLAGAGKLAAGVAGSMATGAALGAAGQAADALNAVPVEGGLGTRMAKGALEFAPMGLPVPVPALRRGYQSLLATALKDSALVAAANPLVEGIAKGEAPDFTQVPAQFAGNIVPFLLLQGMHINDIRQAESWRQNVLKSAGPDAALPDGKPVAGLDYDQLFQALGRGDVPIPTGPPKPLVVPPATTEKAPADGKDSGLVINADEPVMQHLAALARQNREERRQALERGMVDNPTVTRDVVPVLPADITESGLKAPPTPATGDLATPIDQFVNAAKDRQDAAAARRAAELLVRRGTDWGVKEDATPLELQGALEEVRQAAVNGLIPRDQAAPMWQSLNEELQARQALAALGGAGQKTEVRSQKSEDRSQKPRHIPVPAAVGKAAEAYKLGLVRLAEEGGERGQEALRRLVAEGFYPDAQSIDDIPETVRIKALYAENPAPQPAERIADLERQLAELNAQPGADVAGMGAGAAGQLESNKALKRRMLTAELERLRGKSDQRSAVSDQPAVPPGTENSGIANTAIKSPPVVPTPAQGAATAESRLETAPTTTAAERPAADPSPLRTGSAAATPTAEPYQQRREEYAVPAPAGYLGRKEAADVNRQVRQQNEHRAAVEQALLAGKLDRATYTALHKDAYGTFGSKAFNKAFPEFATAGEIVDTVGDFTIRKTPGSQVIRLQRELVDENGKREVRTASKPLVDKPANREKLRGEAKTLLDAEAFDSLALGLFGTEEQQSAMGAPRQTGTYGRAPSAITSADNKVFAEVRKQAAQALGLTPGQTALLQAGPEQRAARLAELQKLEPSPVGTVDELATALQRHGLKRPGGRQRVTKAEAEALASVAARFADTHGVALRDVVAAVRSGTAADAVKMGGLGSEKGATTFPLDGETLGATLHLYRGADASTAVHEFFHAFFPHLSTEHARTLVGEMAKELSAVSDQQSAVPAWARGVVADAAELRAALANLDPLDLTPVQQRLAQEWGARSFERYLRDGQTGVPALREVFAKVAEWMRQIYAAVKGTSIEGQVSAETRRVFEEMLGGEGSPKSEVRSQMLTEGQWGELQQKGTVLGRASQGSGLLLPEGPTTDTGPLPGSREPVQPSDPLLPPKPGEVKAVDGLTGEAKALLESNVVPAFVSKNLERIARENGVDPTGKTPNAIIAELRNRDTGSAAGPVHFQPPEERTDAERVRREDEGWGKALWRYLRTGEGADMPLRVGRTPSVLQFLGAKDLPLLMDAGVVDKVLGEHQIGVDQLQALPAQLRRPVMVFDSETLPGKAVVVLTRLWNADGKPLIAAVHLNERAAWVDVNKVESLYGKDNLAKVQDWINRRLQYVDTEQSQEWLRSSGLQLPKENTTPDSVRKVVTQQDVVNRFGALFQGGEKAKGQSGGHNASSVIGQSVGQSQGHSASLTGRSALRDESTPQAGEVKADAQTRVPTGEDALFQPKEKDKGLPADWVGKRLRDVSRDLPQDAAEPRLLDVGRNNAEITQAAGETFRDWQPTMKAADGSDVLLHNPEGGSLAARVRHLIFDNEGRRLDASKAEWLPNVPDTLANAQLRLVDAETGNRLFVRQYADGTKHLVVVAPDGSVREQMPFEGSLVTQFPDLPPSRHGQMVIDWVRGEGTGFGRSQGNPAPTPTDSTRPGTRPPEFRNESTPPGGEVNSETDRALFQRGELTPEERAAREELRGLIKGAVSRGNLKGARFASDPTPEEAAKVQAVLDKLPAPERVLYADVARETRRQADRLAALPGPEQTKVLDAWLHGRDATVRDANGNRSEFLFQRGESSPESTVQNPESRYRVEERDGRLWVWDGQQDRAYQPGNTIYSKPVDHPNARLVLERMAADLNALEEHATAPGSLRAVDKAVSDQSSAFSGDGGGGVRVGAREGGDGGGGGVRVGEGGRGGEGEDGGKLPPVETHTPTPWRMILGNSGVDLLIKGGGPLKDVAEKVKAYYDRWADLKGQLGKPIRAVLDPLSRSEQRAVLAEFAEYMQARETGDRRPETGDKARRKEKLLAGLRPETRALAKAWDDLTEFTSAENQRLGVKVRDGNRWRDIGSFGRDYWPRMISEEIAEILKQGKGAKYDALIKEAAAHWNVTPERAAQKLTEARSSLQSADDYFANLEAARTAELPAPWYEYRPEVVGARFIDSWAKRFAQIEQFGQVTTGAYAGEKSWSGQAFKDAFQQTRNDPNAALVVRPLHDDVFGVRDKKFYDPAVNALRTYTALSKYVTNPWASLRNLTQPFVTTLPEFGPRAFAKGMWDAILHGKEHWQLAKDAGIIQDDLLAGLVVAEDFNAKQQKIIRNAAKYTGSEFAEQWNRVMTVAAARAWARDALSDLQADPTARKSMLAKAEFQRLEVNWETLAKEMNRNDAHGTEWRKFERAAVTGTQFGYDMRQSPVWSGTPMAKMLFQFQKFGLQMHRRMWQEVVLPATKGDVVDGVTVRNYGKALLTMGAMLGVGEVMLSAVRAMLFDKRRKDADWEEIARTLDKNTWRGMQVALPHLVNNIWYSGALGSLADWGQNAYNTATGFKGKNPLEPPSFSSLRNLITTGMRIFAEEGVNSKQFADWINSELPAINYGGAIAKRLTGQDLLTAREDYRQLKAAGGRFLDEIGEERAKRGGEYTRTWKSPFYDDLFEALVTGDPARAKTVVDEMLARAKDPAEKRDLLQGIKANILSRRPLRAGGVDADTQRAFRQQFAAWLQDRNPELAPKMQALDERYMETAHALGVAPSAAQAALQDKVALAKEQVGKSNRVRQSLVKALADREKVSLEAAQGAYDRFEERRATQPIAPKYQAEIDAAVNGEPPARLAGKVTAAQWQRMVIGQGLQLAGQNAELRAQLAAIQRHPDWSAEEKKAQREALLQAAYVARMERLGRANGQSGALAGFPTLAELRAELRK